MIGKVKRSFTKRRHKPAMAGTIADWEVGEDQRTADAPRALLLLAARRLLLLAIVGAVVLGLVMPPSIPRWYFFHQDLALTAVQLAALLWFARLATSGTATAAPGLRGWQMAVMIAVAAAVTRAGSAVVLEQFAMSRDEQLADFAAGYFQQGLLARAIPTGWAPLAEPLMPLWADGLRDQGWWLSPYLPVNSALRALAGLAGDCWLAGPALLALGAACTVGVARRWWPDQRAGATVALLMMLTSAQVLVNAMSPFSMTAHLALNAAWLWCFTRGGRWHALAMAIGIAATGLHQVQFHLIFASGFVALLLRERRWRLAGGYLLTLACALAFWKVGYPRLVQHVLEAHPAAAPGPAVLGDWMMALLGRLREWQPLNSLLRFAVWQNALMLPLAWVGARGAIDADGRPTPVWAMRISCALGLATTVYQGQGFGYRYLHVLMPLFCLLAARGWLRWQERGVGARVLWASVAVALGVTALGGAWMSHRMLHPYAAAYRMAKTAPADVVLVDARGVAFAQDLVRVDDTLSRPLLLDLAVMNGPSIIDLCRHRRVMILDERQLRPLGLLPPMGVEEPSFAFASRRALLDALHCGRPVPM